MQNKPVRSGYKMWILAASPEYVVNFDPYQGTKNGMSMQASVKTRGLWEGLFLSPLDALPKKTCYRVFMGNFFTFLQLFEFLATSNIRASGTMRENELSD